MLFQPSNIAPSTLSGIGIGTVDVTKGIDVSWQVNGDSPMTDYQITIYKNDTASTQMYTTGQITLSEPFQTHDVNGNPMFFSTTISAATLATAGIVNGYANGYKMIIKQWWGANDYVEQTSAAVFITRTTPTLSIDAISSPVTTSSTTITATYSQAQGDPISTVEWVFSLAGLEDTPIKQTGAINTQVLSFNVDGLITGNTYSIMCNVVTSSGMEVSTGYVQFDVSYASTMLDGDYQVAQLCNSSAAYLSWANVEGNILPYPYYNSTKTTNGITFTVNGEGDITANGTATADAYFTLANGTISALGLTAGEKLIITSRYTSARILVTETDGSNNLLSSVEGNDPLQYVVPQTSNILSFSIKIPAGMSASSQKLSPMLYVEDDIETVDDATITINPIQDLHGYSKPWAAGAGRNKMPYPWFKSQGSTSFGSGGTATFNSDGSISLSGTTTAQGWLYQNTYNAQGTYNFEFPAGDYIMSAEGVTGGSASGYRFQMTVYSKSPYSLLRTYYVYNGETVNVHINAGECEACYLYVPSGKNCDGITYKPMLRLSTDADSSYVPYENICPITGRTSAKIYRFGKNLFNKNGVSSTAVTITQNSSGFRIVSNANGTYKACSGGFQFQTLDFPDGTEVTFSAHCKVNSGKARLGIRRVSDNALVAYSSLVSSGEADLSITYTYDKSTPVYLSMFCTLSESEAGDVEYTNIQLEIGSTVTSYEPYARDTYAVDWTSVAGTIYKGSFDSVPGTLAKTQRSFDFQGVTPTSVSVLGEMTRFWLYDVNALANGNMLCNMAPVVDNTYYASDEIGVIYLSAYPNSIAVKLPTSLVGTTVESIRTFLQTGAFQMVQDLVTPVEYQLTPQEVAVFAETNSIWSNVGSISVTYTTNKGAQSTVSGPIVSFNDSNAQIISLPAYRPQVSSSSIYRYAQGEPILHRVYDFADKTSELLDYFAPSQSNLSYLIVAHGNSSDVFVPTNTFKPVFWFYSILLCSQDSNGIYHVRNEYVFKYGVETGGVSNNNAPALQQNFTRYPTRQPVNSLYKTGTLKGYIGTVTDQKLYTDSVSLQNAIYNISTSTLTKFLKTRKGETIMVECSSPIQMQTGDNMVQQPLVATIDWVEVGDCSDYSIVSVPSDGFWPL